MLQIRRLGFDFEILLHGNNSVSGLEDQSCLQLMLKTNEEGTMWAARNHETGQDSWKKMIAPVTG